MKSSANAAQLPVLIADDNKEVLRVVQNVVRYFGYDCKGFDTGEDLLQYVAADGRNFLCIVDVTLPGMSGYEVLDQLEASGNHSQVILMSGEVRDDWSGSAALIGYLQKPFGFASLQQLLESWQASQLSYSHG